MSDERSGNRTHEDSTNDQQATVPATAVRPEASETLPLNKSAQLNKRSWCCSDDTDGLNAIIGFFTTFTLAVTIALIAQIHSGAYEVTPHGSVSTDSEICSLLGTDILKKGGNAVDAAVASSFCMGVVHPHMTGLGGGGFLMVYDHRRRRVVEVIDFRETAPMNLPPSLSAPGGEESAFVGVPGFLRGLHSAHKTFGLLPWSEIIEPSIHLARQGVPVSQSLLDSKEQVDLGSLGNEAFSQLLKQIVPDASLLQSQLADTLEVIAEHGPDALYNGSLSIKLVSTLSNQSLMSLDDLALYREEHRHPLVASIGNYSVMVPGAPSGGPLLLAVLGILGTPEDNPGWWQPDQSAKNLQRLADTLRLAGLYHAQLGDPDQSAELVMNATLQMTDPHELLTRRKEVEDGGGPNANWSNRELPQPAGSFVGVVDTQDLYVAVISGLNSQFGSRLMTPLGFILNDALNNFTPRSGTVVVEGSNVATPGRRPLSLAVPAVVVRAGAPCGQRMVLGSADASVAVQALASVLATQQDVGQAVEQPRVTLHNRHISFEAWHSPLLPENVLTELDGLGYRMMPMRPPYVGVNVIQKRVDTISAHSDSRGGGGAISY